MAKLSELKLLLEAARRKDRPNTKPIPERRPRSVRAAPKAEADVDFEAAVGRVDRLPEGNRAPVHRSSPSTLPLQRMRDDAQALLASKFGNDPAPVRWEIGQEHEEAQTFVRPGIGTDALTRLRRGHWVIQQEIDLHGMTSEEAHDALADFLLDARNRRARCVKVIHGKGLSSPNREPVLKGKVRRWLSRWDHVLAYCEAPVHHGGSGAVLVLLKAAGS